MTGSIVQDILEDMASELRRKSDIARKLLEEKDAELEQMAEKLTSFPSSSKGVPSSSTSTVETIEGPNVPTLRESEGKSEYLSKAFEHFVMANTAGERESLARVICSLLAFSSTDEKNIASHAKLLVKAPLGITSVEDMTQVPSLEAIEKYSIEQFTPENLQRNVASWLGWR